MIRVNAAGLNGLENLSDFIRGSARWLLIGLTLGESGAGCVGPPTA